MNKPTKQHIERIKKVGRILQGGDLAIIETVFEMEDKLTNSIADVVKGVPTLEQLVTKVKGDKGDRGNDGDDGINGDQGPAGPVGPQGPKGDSVVGPHGVQGKDGLPGTPGEPGKDGTDGRDGKDGSPDSPSDIASKLNTLAEAVEMGAIKGMSELRHRVSVSASLPPTTTNFLNNGRSIGRAKNINLIGATAAITGDQANITVSSFSSPLTTKGDIHGYSTTDARIPIGSNGSVLIADSTKALGVQWSNILSTANGGTGGNSLLAAGVVSIFGNVVAVTFANADMSGTLTSTGNLIRVSYSLQDTAADVTAGAVTITISYTDGAGATTATATQVLTGIGRVSGSVFIQRASGSVTYATTHTGLYGSALYSVYISTELIN